MRVGDDEWLESLTPSGPARLLYAHICDKVHMVAEGVPTYERVRTKLNLGSPPATFPTPTTLVVGLEEFGGTAGRRELAILIHGGPDSSESVAMPRAELEFELFKSGYPLMRHSWFDNEPWTIEGPGIYYFDFVLGKQFVGRLPILLKSAEGETPEGKVIRGAHRGDFISMEWGHLMERCEVHDNGESATFHNIIRAIPTWPDAEPFGLPSSLVFQLTAPDTFEPNDHLTIRARDPDGEALAAPVEIDFTMFPGLPGEIVMIPQIPCDAIQYRAPGTYDYQILVDGQPVGSVDVLVSMGDSSE